MNAITAHSARPLGTAIAWATKTELFVEIPCKDGPPYICRYPKTANGLAQALNVLVENTKASTTYAIQDRTRTAKPTLAHPKVRREAPITESQREAARAVLKRLKII